MGSIQIIQLAAALVGACGVAGPTPGNVTSSAERYEFRETHMGTEFKLVVYTNGERRARRASRFAFDRVARLDQVLSDYKLDSELNRLCRQAGGPPVVVSDDLFSVLSKAAQMAERTDGAFDPTVKPVVKLWRRARRRHELPDPDQLKAARALVDFRLMHLDARKQTVQLAKPGMRLDLGGIAKGLAADAALAVLRDRGITTALVAAAGDIVTGDPPPGTSGWRIGIAPLDDPDGQPSRFLSLSHAAISTSGDSAQYVVIDGVRYSHIVDPRTGLGVVERASVTVVAPRGALADSLATSVYVMGPEQGRKLIESTPGTEALIVCREGDGTVQVIESSGWSELPEPAADEPDPPAPDSTETRVP